MKATFSHKKAEQMHFIPIFALIVAHPLRLTQAAVPTQVLSSLNTKEK